MSKILIYGGDGGIGSAMARLLHAKGHVLHLVGRDETRLSALAGELNATFTVGDVCDDELFKRVMMDVGDALDGLVYAVGTINLKSIVRLTEADFVRDMRINAIGAALAVQAAVPALKKTSRNTASVLLFSSIAARQGFALHASIGMAKAAVNGLTVSLAAELAPKIRVNAIAPSLTQTPLAAGLLANQTTANAIAAAHPLPRLGTADDMASMGVFLMSNEADWVTGQIFAIDGGRSTLALK